MEVIDGSTCSITEQQHLHQSHGLSLSTLAKLLNSGFPRLRESLGVFIGKLPGPRKSGNSWNLLDNDADDSFYLQICMLL